MQIGAAGDDEQLTTTTTAEETTTGGRQVPAARYDRPRRHINQMPTDAPTPSA